LDANGNPLVTRLKPNSILLVAKKELSKVLHKS